MCFIQMLCEDYEVFLEMAHVLKGLDVSILKGVLEHRSAKLWASFVIEVYIKDSCFQPILEWWCIKDRLRIRAYFEESYLCCTLPYYSQASGGLSQMQILCPLMHLLHRRWS